MRVTDKAKGFVDALFEAIGIKPNDQQKAAATLALRTRDEEDPEGNKPKDELDPDAPKQDNTEQDPPKTDNNDPDTVDEEDPEVLKQMIAELQAKIAELESAKEGAEEATEAAAEALGIDPDIEITKTDSVRSIREKVIDSLGFEKRASMRRMSDAEVNVIYTLAKRNMGDGGLGQALLGDAGGEPTTMNINGMYRGDK
jgi:hypothetical protein